MGGRKGGGETWVWEGNTGQCPLCTPPDWGPNLQPVPGQDPMNPDLSVCGTRPNRPSHTGQGYDVFLIVWPAYQGTSKGEN